MSLTRLTQILAIATGEALAARRAGHGRPEQVHRTVVRLGPTFVKLGQVASTRPDLVPADISARLEDLQEAVPPFAFTDARRVVEAELGKPLEEAFAAFPTEPIASASLSQVYFAALPDGTPVAVKVQRPGIRSVIEQDLAILRRAAGAAGRLRRSLRDLRPRRVVDEFGRWTLQELDFEVEGRNLDEFRRNFADWDDVVFPEVHWTHTTPRVLTMQRVAGLRLWQVPEQVGPATARQLARRLAELQMKMFISDQFFHADLHPGNVFFAPDGRIAILDVGMVGRMTAAQRDRFLAYWIAITRRQRDLAFDHLLAMADSTRHADLDGFRTAYDDLLDAFYAADLSERSLAQTYLEIVVTGARYGVTFPSSMILQAKAVVTAEALDLVLAPDFRFADEVRPIVARELAARATPGALADRLWSGLADWVLLGEWPATATPPRAVDGSDEDAFRRAATEAVADVWADAADGRLRRAQTDIDRYTSAEHWQQRPELHALAQTLLGLAHQLASATDRLEQRRDGDHPAPTGNGQTKQTRRSIALLEHDARSYHHPRFWADQHLTRAALTATLTFLRLLVGRSNRALVERTRSTSRPGS